MLEQPSTQDTAKKPALEVGRFEAVSTARSSALDLAARAARWRCPILIMGPSGVGKDLLAEEIHHMGRRASAPFVTVNCGATPAAQFDAEVFGAHKPGLVEAAHGGTLFFDEVAEMPHGAQAKLLAFLSKGSVVPAGSTCERRADVRVIAATSRDLREVLGKSLRLDLFYRLSIVTIGIPELSADDAERIATTLVRGASAEYGLGVLPPRVAALSRGCAKRRWPGGVREMKSAIERCIILDDDELPTASLLSGAAGSPESAAVPDMHGLKRIGDLLFVAMLREAGSVRLLATHLDCTQQTIYNRLRRIQGNLRTATRSAEALDRVLSQLRDDVSKYHPWVRSVFLG